MSDEYGRAWWNATLEPAGTLDGYVLACASAGRPLTAADCWGYTADDERCVVWRDERDAERFRWLCTAEPARWCVVARAEAVRAERR
jgi:hypothetical protein